MESNSESKSNADKVGLRASSRLRGKKPLRCDKKLEGKTRLRPVAKTINGFRARYLAQVKEQTRLCQEHRCPVCGIEGFCNLMDPHHPAGRIGENILNYFFVHRTCHTWIHNNPKEAKSRGLLS